VTSKWGYTGRVDRDSGAVVGEIVEGGGNVWYNGSRIKEYWFLNSNGWGMPVVGVEVVLTGCTTTSRLMCVCLTVGRIVAMSARWEVGMTAGLVMAIASRGITVLINLVITVTHGASVGVLVAGVGVNA